MDRVGSKTLVQLCRRQAAMASTPEVRATLLELADIYEADDKRHEELPTPKPDNDKQ